MRQVTILLLALLVMTGTSSGDVYWVKHSGDSGTGSLRWAITQANNHAGRDKIVFLPRMAGKIIMPLTVLPSITDNRTIIDGDIDGDQKPDVGINGRKQSSGNGLTIVGADHCVIRYLAVCNFPCHGIKLLDASDTTIQGCHVGVNLEGTKAVYNSRGIAGAADIALENSDYNYIGGT
jgi:hypothetical protein